MFNVFLSGSGSIVKLGRFLYEPEWLHFKVVPTALDHKVVSAGILSSLAHWWITL